MTFIETAYNYVGQGLAPFVSSAALTTRHALLQTRSLEKRYDLCYTDPIDGTTYYCNGGSHCTSDFTCSPTYYWTAGVAGGVILLCILSIWLRRRRQRLAMMGGPMVMTTVIPGRDYEAQPQLAPIPQPQYTSYPPPQPYDAYGQPSQNYAPLKDQQPPMGYAPPSNAAFGAAMYPSPSIANNSSYPQPAPTPYLQPASSPYSQPASSPYSQPASSPYSQPAPTPSVAPAPPYPGQPQNYEYAQPGHQNETVTYIPSPQK